jgi:hypothetical protein|tara:strand:+ start:3520 stop:3780 length:261 start_codon:yes stop_codon:yes gene_type:complete
METQITPIQLVLAIPSLVCLVIAWVSMFKQGKTGLGITSILLTLVCGIGSLIAFVWGWMNGNVSTKVMIVWTLLTVASIIAGALGA